MQKAINESYQRTLEKADEEKQRQEDNKQIAYTIINQLGADFADLTGSNKFKFGEDKNGVAFLHIPIAVISCNAKKLTHARISLEFNDTYTMRFYRGKDIVETLKDCYCDTIRTQFEIVTGLKIRNSI